MIKINIQTKKVALISYNGQKYTPLVTPRTDHLRDLSRKKKLIAKVTGNQVGTFGVYHGFKMGNILKVTNVGETTVECNREQDNFDQIVERKHLQFFKLKE